MSLRNRTPQEKSHASPDTGLLSEAELIALYIKESGPGYPGPFAASDMSDVLAGALDSSGSEELKRGLDLIEYMGHEGLQIEYRAVQKKSLSNEINATSSPEIFDVSSVDTCGHIRDTEYDTDYDDTDSLMECGDTFAYKSEPLSPTSGISTDFSLNRLLDSIQTRHFNVSSGFQGAQVRLERLREQNGLDSAFLGKLHSSNELMRDKIHDMKSEIAEILRDIESMKRDVGQNVDSPTNHPSGNGDNSAFWSVQDSRTNTENDEKEQKESVTTGMKLEIETGVHSTALEKTSDDESAGESNGSMDDDSFSKKEYESLRDQDGAGEDSESESESYDSASDRMSSPFIIEHTSTDDETPNGCESCPLLLENNDRDTCSESARKDKNDWDLQLALRQPVMVCPAGKAVTPRQPQSPQGGILRHKRPSKEYLSTVLMLAVVLAGICMGYGRP